MKLSVAGILLFFITACGANIPQEVGAQDSAALEPAFPALAFNQPVDLQNAADSSGRLFVAEQPGVIRVFENTPGVSSSRVFLDIRDRVVSGGERGLLGLAFHPDYAQNGYFYVNYTTPGPLRTRISRFQVDAADPNRALPESEQALLSFEQPFDNHNGGQIAFGPDGFLYVATGDGGSGGDPQNNAQNRSNLLGKILRIDVDQPEGGSAYGIPPDNPFAGNASGYREEIYAYGLRNPWRFSFDPPTGRLWAADVGQGRIEEIDLIERGGNYGWRIREGSSCFNPSSGCASEGLIMPVAEYGHDLGQSVTGGYVYRGSSAPELEGAYLYADYVSGRVWALRYNGPGNVENTLLFDTDYSVSTFGVDEQGELYLVDRAGSLYRFVSAGSPTSSESGAAELPERLVLRGYPNPFSEAASLRYVLNAAASVELRVVDMLGRVVYHTAAGRQIPGEHELVWNPGALPAGVYLCRLLANGATVGTRKLIYAP